MRTEKFTSDLHCQVTVGTTAASLKELLTTAGVDFSEQRLSRCNAVDLCPEGNIRYLHNGNTPTTSLGLRLAGGATAAECQTRQFRGDSFSEIKLCAETGTVLVNVVIGRP